MEFQQAIRRTAQGHQRSRKTGQFVQSKENNWRQVVRKVLNDDDNIRVVCGCSRIGRQTVAAVIKHLTRYHKKSLKNVHFEHL